MNNIPDKIVDRPICLLLGALGGQGGGVLIDWLVTAAKRSGYPAQATSTPGVAQRTGATTYYFELFPEKNPISNPIFTFFPASDDLDLMIAMEPTEAGRAIERGFVTDCTTVITAIERVYSTSEKVSAGDGRIDIIPVLEAIEKASKKLIQLDIAQLSTGTAARGNAITFGAIIGSGVLPLTSEDCRAAISTKGVAVTSNLVGFEIGFKAITEGNQSKPNSKQLLYETAPSEFAAQIEEFPKPAREIISHGIAKLIDYQNIAYAKLYLKRLHTILTADKKEQKKLTAEVARHLARWMSFEDVIRVAQLKTRRQRLPRIRDELKADAQTPLRLIDYFKPGREEFLGIIPKGFSWLVPPIKQGIALHIPTGTAFGFAMLKFLSILKPFRSKSIQYIEEQKAIEQWLKAVIKVASLDNHLACQTAKLAILARGYGNVRRTGLSKLDILFSNWEIRLANNITGIAAEVDQLNLIAHSNPDII
jgi:indolepyruvate ferredoxin oxidoreductase beta subunit